MKKILLFTVIVFIFCIDLTAQARIGRTESQIRSEFYSKTFTLSTTTGGKAISWEDGTRSVDYILNDQGICYMCMVWPANQGILNFMVEDYNKKYVIVSDKDWKMYNENGILNISLVFLDNGKYFFFYVENK